MQVVDVQFINDQIVEALSFCIDTSVQLNANGVDPTATYVWTSNPVDPTLVSTDKNPTVSPEVVTVYTVVISQGTLCTVTYQVTVTPLDGANLQLQNDTTVCNDMPITITASGNGLSYEWSESPTFVPIFATGATVTITPVKDGIYYVRTSNSFGCAALDSIKINNGSIAIQPEPFDGDICAGQETQLMVTNLDLDDMLTYSWTPNLPNVANPSVSPSEETNYHVVVSNQFGCTDELDFNVKVTTVGVDAEVTGSDVLHPGQSTTLLATPSGSGTVISYEWSPASSLSNPNIPDPVAMPEADQVYVVTVTTADGCTATDEVLVRFVPGQCLEPYIFVPNTFTPNNDSNNDFFIVRGVNITEVLFIVWNRWGEKMYQTTDLAAKGWDGTFNGVESTPDAYAWYLRAVCGDGSIYIKKGDVTLLK